MRGRSSKSHDTPRDSRHDFWGVALEAPDPYALARFYAELLDWELGPEGLAVAPVDGVTYIAFQHSEGYVRPRWPAQEGEPRITMHLDFEVEDLAAAVEHAQELGAELADFQPQDNVRVMLDPVGHPFCLYTGD